VSPADITALLIELEAKRRKAQGQRMYKMMNAIQANTQDEEPEVSLTETTRPG
jgi:tRNA uridine 5-carboxymethylaminomethyl modification enzyme